MSRATLVRLLSVAVLLGLLPAVTSGQEKTTGHALGPPDADVVVTIFTDFGCSAVNG